MRKCLILLTVFLFCRCAYLQERTLVDDISFFPENPESDYFSGSTAQPPPLDGRIFLLTSMSWKNGRTTFTIPDLPGVIIVVNKSSRLVQLYQNRRLLESFSADMNNQLADCLSANDNQVPEGAFYLEELHEQGEWGPTLYLNTLDKAKSLYYNTYPGNRQRLDVYERALGRPLLTRADIESFNRKYPQQKLLSGISLHGGGLGGGDWIDGSIALEMDDARRLYDIIRTNPNGGVGTLVLIQD